MIARAFIIAIEQYEYLPSLTGVNDDANQFYSWLVENKGVKTDSIFACADRSACPWATNGTKAEDITAELSNLWEKVRDWSAKGDPTGEFYFYYSGHGFANTKTVNDKPVDHLVASDFKNNILSGNKCLEFYQIKEKLYRSLGPMTHYYFIDACRNTDKDVDPTGLSFNPPQAKNGSEGPAFWLFSTAKQEVAARDSEFARALIQGLRGAGTAADWYKSKYWVMFTNLYEYVDARIQKQSSQQVDADQEGKGRGLILEVKPVPEYECEIVIDNATAQDKFTLSLSTNGNRPQKIEFTGASYKFNRPPGYYNLMLSHPDVVVVQEDPPPSEDGISFFDNLVVRFKLGDPLAGKPSSARARGARAKADVTLRGLPADEIRFESVQSGDIQFASGTLVTKVNPGDYWVHVHQRGVKVGSKRLNLRPGKRVNLDLRTQFDAGKSPLRDECVRIITSTPDPPIVKLRQSLGPLINWDFSLVLSLLGAAKIVSSPHEFPFISGLPLGSFGGIQPGQCAVYMLGGFEKSKGAFEVGVSDNEAVEWLELPKVKSLGIHQKLIPTSPGPHLVSIRIPGQKPITYATHCLPNRATLIVLTETEAGRLAFHQYILPIRPLFDHLDMRVRDYIETEPLRVVRLMFLAQKQFVQKRPVFERAGGPIEADALLYGKWLDPILSLIGAYELIREGVLEKNPDHLNTMLNNLRTYFPGLADTEAIAKVAGQPWSMPNGSPLLRESILAFDETQEQRILPLPYDQVDYGSAWTSWRGLVRTSKE